MVSESASTQTSFGRIAGEVFQDSLVTGVPNVGTEHHNVKKILKMLYLCVCVFGFSFQVTRFYELYSTYPTMIEMSFPRNLPIMKPAITICNNSPVRRSLYCKRHSRWCVKPVNFTSFCKHFPYYCIYGPDKMNNFMVLLDMFSINLKTTDKADLIQMNHKSAVMLGSRHKVFLEDAYLTMVYKRIRYYATCYRTNYGADNDLLPSTLESTDLKTDRKLSNRKTRTLMDRYMIYMVSHEIVTKIIAPGAMLAIHEPFDPSFDPHMLEPGKHYRIFIRMEQEKLLPYPYATDCRNYTEEWISNNKTGPKSKEMCIVMCESKVEINDCDCKPFYLYEGDAFLLKDLCNVSCENTRRLRQDWDKDECLKTCKENCEKWRYFYTIKESDISPQGSLVPDFKEWQAILL